MVIPTALQMAVNAGLVMQRSLQISPKTITLQDQ
jgi:hypothetical protein